MHAWIFVRGRKPGPLFLPVNKHGQLTFTPEHMSSQAIYNAVTKRRTAAGLEPLSPHDFRRTFITTLLRQKADLFAVQDLAGHSDLKTTKKYDKRGEDAKKEAAMKASVPYVDPDK